jgi:hypothetical protein
MIRHPKSPEQLQAQVAAFASNRIQNLTNRDYILSHLPSLAEGTLKDVVRVTDSTEYERRSDGNGYIVTPEGAEVVAGSAADYVGYLRDADSRDQVMRRTRLLENYQQFDRLADAATEVLGSGSRAEVRRIVGSDGRAYAVRIPKGPRVDIPSVEHKVRAALRGQGIPHLEQIVGVSYEKGRTISEVMPGIELTKLSAAELARHITDDQLDTYIRTIISAYKAGIIIDPKPSNVLYDTQEGFGIIDYNEHTAVPGRSDVTLADMIRYGAYALTGTGRKVAPSVADSGRDTPERTAHILAVLGRFRERCVTQFGDTGEIIDAVDTVVNGMSGQA